MQTALFLDLGDTLVRVEDDEIYTDDSGLMEFLPNVERVLAARQAEFDAVFVVTNQSGIEKGTLTMRQADAFAAQVGAALGGRLTDFWASPRLQSDFRKPNPGMVLALADKHWVDPGRSTMVGDSENDRRCAQAAGVGRFVWAWDFFEREKP